VGRRVLIKLKELMRLSKVAMIAFGPIVIAGGALAQTALPPGPGPDGPRTTGAIITVQPNTTGNDRDVIIAPGATGADTITTNSASGGNASHPERAVPNGSAGSSGGGEGGG
jgi:hypothetical protein